MKRAPQTLPLLVEVGCEEIPARFLSDAQKNFGERLKSVLEEARLLDVGAIHPVAQSPGLRSTGHESPLQAGQPRVGAKHHVPVQTFSTPRRLTVYIPQVLDMQPDQMEEVHGPPVRVAFDASGKPTRAAEGFAAKQEVRVKDLVRVPSEKGEYVAVRKKTPGRPAASLLGELLPAAISGFSFPKSMYWQDSKLRFVRPIRWILALLGEGKMARVVPFEFAGVATGNLTYGHRATGLGPIKVQGFAHYAKKLRQAQVEFDPEKRRETVRSECQKAIAKAGLKTVQDDWLADWVVNSTEWPRAVAGQFDERFLKLPREVLVTVMRDHQKDFAVEDGKVNIQPQFVAVLNVDADKKGLIRAGHERVLAARFKDAEFFWDADQKVPLRLRVERLNQVTYQANLGSYSDKVRRMTALARTISEALKAQPSLGFEEPGATQALRAVELSKCDLTTQMVQEFPELQGIVGGLYARGQGEPQAVAEAIYDHYLPQALEGITPRSVVGAVVSLADKMDSIAAGFALGREPSGSSDPFALRRQANGVIKVLLELHLPISLKQMAQEALNGLEIDWRRPREEVFEAVVDFLNERLRYYFETVRKFRYDTVRAVQAASSDPPLEALERAEALETMRGGHGIEALAAAAKRIKNILAKSAKASDWAPGEVATALIEEGPEVALYNAFKLARDDADRARNAGDYGAALKAIAGLRPYVDRFFDKVLVMAEERERRQNRLRLLARLDELFSSLAHFAEIADVDAPTLKAVASEK